MEARRRPGQFSCRALGPDSDLVHLYSIYKLLSGTLGRYPAFVNGSDHSCSPNADGSLRSWCRALERIRGQSAVLRIWHEAAGADFANLHSAFLRAGTTPVRFVPCVNGCGCAHEVFAEPDGSFAGVCRCETSSCDDLKLQRADVLPWELNWVRLARAIAQALDLKPASGWEWASPGFLHAGAFGAAQLPAFLAVQSCGADYRRGIAELCGSLRGPFLLFAPTLEFVDAAARQLLRNIGAAVFAMDNALLLRPGGVLLPRQAPAMLFRELTPKSVIERDAEAEQVARKAMQLVCELDRAGLESPSMASVMHAYCVEQMSSVQIARRFHCSKATVVRRLQLLHRKLGVTPQSLRGISPHLERMADEFSDARARRIARYAD